jgi:hypothetical protein
VPVWLNQAAPTHYMTSGSYDVTADGAHLYYASNPQLYRQDSYGGASTLIVDISQPGTPMYTWKQARSGVVLNGVWVMADGSLLISCCDTGLSDYDGTHEYTRLYRSTDAGATWTESTTARNLNGLIASDACLTKSGNCVAYCDYSAGHYCGYGVWYSGDNGATWTQVFHRWPTYDATWDVPASGGAGYGGAGRHGHGVQFAYNDPTHLYMIYGDNGPILKLTKPANWNGTDDWTMAVLQEGVGNEGGAMTSHGLFVTSGPSFLFANDGSIRRILCVPSMAGSSANAKFFYGAPATVRGGAEIDGIMFAAGYSMGSDFSTSKNEGLYASVDGGVSWVALDRSNYALTSPYRKWQGHLLYRDSSYTYTWSIPFPVITMAAAIQADAGLTNQILNLRDSAFVADASQSWFATNPTNTTGSLYWAGSVWGGKIHIGANPVVVTHLERWVCTGNTHVHTVQIIGPDQTTVVATAQVNCDTGNGAVVGTMAYTALAAHVTLSANTDYYIVDNFATGDYCLGGVAVPPALGNHPTIFTQVATLTGRVNGGIPGDSGLTLYGGVSFRYQNAANTPIQGAWAEAANYTYSNTAGAVGGLYNNCCLQINHSGTHSPSYVALLHSATTLTIAQPTAGQHITLSFDVKPGAGWIDSAKDGAAGNSIVPLINGTNITQASYTAANIGTTGWTRILVEATAGATPSITSLGIYVYGTNPGTAILYVSDVMLTYDSSWREDSYQPPLNVRADESLLCFLKGIAAEWSLSWHWRPEWGNEACLSDLAIAAVLSEGNPLTPWVDVTWQQSSGKFKLTDAQGHSALSASAIAWRHWDDIQFTLTKSGGDTILTVTNPVVGTATITGTNVTCGACASEAVLCLGRNGSGDLFSSGRFSLPMANLVAGGQSLSLLGVA